MRTAGIVLDIYDDAKGLVLRKKTASNPIPEKLASSRLLAVEELDALPNRLFALVADNGNHVLRKYAMHDDAHVATSIIYFLECGHLLPDETRSKVAKNLINGCAWYDIDPPEPLVKIALAKTASGREIRLSLAEDAAMQRGEGPEAGHIFGPLSEFSNREKTHDKIDRALEKKDQPEPVVSSKTSNLNGTEIMPNSGVLRTSNPRPSPNNKVSLPAKTSAAKVASATVDDVWLHSGDLHGLEPKSVVKTSSYSIFALPHEKRYPIDTPELIKRAEGYFDENFKDFSLEDRRVFAQCVVQRADELGIKVAGAMLDYSGNDYGPFIESELVARIHSFEGTGHEEVYNLLLEKKASTDPLVMVEMLKEADADTGADRCYGRPGTGFRDPYRAVYGSDKLAAEKKEEYSWSAGTDYVSGMQLCELAQRGFKELDEIFGKPFAESFQRDPVGIFASMPDPQKVVLSRLASTV